MLILYLAVLGTALYAVSKLLLPEMAKPSLPKAPAEAGSFDISPSETSDISAKRIEKLEVLLAEKNKNIKILQAELTVFLVQVRDFNKVKSLLEDEVHRLKEQNRIFRSELGLPTIHAAVEQKENSLT